MHSDQKATVHQYLADAREALLWKLDGLSEYDVRRPLTMTGTNLLGLIKHVASVEVVYLGTTFGRPFDVPMPWFDEGEAPNADMWTTPEEPREQILSLYARAQQHADATIEALDLDSIGVVPHWPSEGARITLHHAMVRMVAETNRHAGHADIIREGLDGAVGYRQESDNLWVDEAGWGAHRDRIEAAARRAAGVD